MYRNNNVIYKIALVMSRQKQWDFRPSVKDKIIFFCNHLRIMDNEITAWQYRHVYGYPVLKSLISIYLFVDHIFFSLKCWLWHRPRAFTSCSVLSVTAASRWNLMGIIRGTEAREGEGGWRGRGLEAETGLLSLRCNNSSNMNFICLTS